MNIDESDEAARSLAAKENLFFPTLLATPQIVGIYNILYRYLFDRRRDLPLPTSFLVDRDGMIIKIYQGVVTAERVLDDLQSLPQSPDERTRKALPFAGTLYEKDGFRRNDFTYGVALFQRGYLDQGATAFRQVNDAVRNFKQSLNQRPDYATALLNLGNVYRRQGNSAEAEKLLKRALELEPENPEVNYSLGMLYARLEQIQLALQNLERAVSLRPDYADALNNLGVFFVREERYPEAETKFKACIRAAPSFDQGYLNLARLYVILREKDKAREVLQALLQRQPQHKMAQEALQMLN